MKVRFAVLATLLLSLAMIGGCNSTTVTEESASSDGSGDAGKTEMTAAQTTKDSAGTSADSYINGLWADDDTIPTSLTIGDTAPAVHVSEWVHGEELVGFPKGKVTVVEFWATWCGPCLASMPHMSELQEQYRDDVTFIGVTNETPDTVKGFLEGPVSKGAEETWHDKIKYNLVIDADGNPTNAGYMQAASQMGIPTAFIVGRDGVVEWIGHPIQIDQPLDEVVSGKWDRDAAKTALTKQQELQKIQQQLGMAMQSGDSEKALELLEKLAAEKPDLPLEPVKIDILLSSNRGAEALELIAGMKDKIWDNPQLLNQFAWGMVAQFPEDARDANLGLEFAERGVELTQEKDPMILDTLARAHYEKGDLKAAIEWQEKAVALSPDDQIGATLKQYQSELAEADGAEGESETADEASAGEADAEGEEGEDK